MPKEGLARFQSNAQYIFLRRSASRPTYPLQSIVYKNTEEIYRNGQITKYYPRPMQMLMKQKMTFGVIGSTVE